MQGPAILTAIRAMGCRYVWNAHAPAARREGVSDALVDGRQLAGWLTLDREVCGTGRFQIGGIHMTQGQSTSCRLFD